MGMTSLLLISRRQIEELAAILAQRPRAADNTIVRAHTAAKLQILEGVLRCRILDNYSSQADPQNIVLPEFHFDYLFDRDIPFPAVDATYSA